MPPDLIAGRYRVTREVGRGGMGMVWLCRDERLDRDVAVKQVGGLPGESSMHFARALREARHSAALNHPHVVAMFDVIEEGNVVWLVMEYVPSRTLSQIIKTDGPMPPERAARIGAQVADGLAAAHARGTIHRDVKPSNILVGDDDLAKISDFGIARAIDEEQLTRSGLVTGTPSYFSPEQARGEEPTPASDVWALGASLYAAVEGRPLYPEQSNAIAMLRVIAEASPARPEHAGALGRALGRMLDPDQGTRWTMAEAAAELRALGAEKIVPEEQPTKAFSVAPPPPDDPGPPAPVDTVERPVAVVTTGGGPRGRRPAVLALVLLLLLVAVAAGGYWLMRDPDEQTADPGGQTPADTPSQADSPSTSPSESQEAPPEPDSDPSASSSDTGGAAAPPATDADDPAAFVSEYYSYLPDDTDTSWQMLSPELQDQVGRGSYEGFWASIQDVSVDEVADEGDGAVLVTLTYTTTSGTEQEDRRLIVEESGGDFVITDDQGAV